MFQDGVKKTISSTSRAHNDWPQLRLEQTKLALAPREESCLPANDRLSWHKVDVDLCVITYQSTTKCGDESGDDTTGTGFLLFPFNNFGYSLTLFSKFFASFPHGTCALSVSHRYLAFCGIYHMLCAEIPINTTRWKHLPLNCNPQTRTGVSPSRLSFSKVLGPGTNSMTLLQTTIRCTSSRKWERGPSRLVAQIHKVSFSLFSRPYWENHDYFLFLRLLICLNSAGSLSQSEIWL